MDFLGIQETRFSTLGEAEGGSDLNARVIYTSR